MIVTVNLKTAITFRVQLPQGFVAFSIKAFRGEQGGTGNIPEPRDLVPFAVHEILIEASDPWLPVAKKPVTIKILWANVLSVHYDEEVL